jgi:hypothetical protein
LTVAADSVALAGQSGEGLIDGHGMIDLAGGIGELRGVAGELRFALSEGAALPVVNSDTLDGGDWPLRIGSHSSVAGGDDVSRGRAARRGVWGRGGGLRRGL